MKEIGKISLPWAKRIGDQELRAETVITVLTDGKNYFLHVIADSYPLTPRLGELYKCIPEGLCDLDDLICEVR